MENLKKIPQLQRIGDRQAIHIDGKPMLLLAGEVHNSNTSSLEIMEPVWAKAKDLGMNCLLLPVTWELLEPEEGIFDFSLVHGLIEQARKNDMKIVFLWFGTWKNAQSSYAPEWVKTDTERFRRAELVKGQISIKMKKFYNMSYSPLTYLCIETMEADARAFGRLMKEIREFDADERTVVSVQVENESGIMVAARDHSDEADALFYGNVPDDFAEYMHSHTETMVPSIRDAVMNGQNSGSWPEMFGSEAEEVFSAYYTARYVNTVAEAGKKEYPLPFSVNCWLDREGVEAGMYPSGGPISKVREVWNFCAPCIDIYGPDIYLPAFHEICEEYTRRGEGLYIPECAAHSYAASRNLISIGKYNAIAYSPFGFEDMGQPLDPAQMALFGADANDPALSKSQDPMIYGEINRHLSSMMDLLCENYGTDHLDASSGEFESDTDFHMGEIAVKSHYTQGEGGCLILQGSVNEFYILAYKTRLCFESLNPQKPGIDILTMEEGCFSDGKWKRLCRLNGDETAGNSYEADAVKLLHVKLFVY